MVQTDDTAGLWQEFQKSRDQAVRDRLILTYAPLVKYVAGRLGSGLPAHVDDGDLVSYGLLGLISAIERYEPDRDVKFETYAIARLPEREKLVVTLYYYEELTLREIGEVLGVTESRVSQLHTKAVLRLKAHLGGVPARDSAP